MNGGRFRSDAANSIIDIYRRFWDLNPFPKFFRMRCVQNSFWSRKLKRKFIEDRIYYFYKHRFRGKRHCDDLWVVLYNIGNFNDVFLQIKTQLFVDISLDFLNNQNLIPVILLFIVLNKKKNVSLPENWKRPVFINLGETLFYPYLTSTNIERRVFSGLVQAVFKNGFWTSGCQDFG